MSHAVNPCKSESSQNRFRKQRPRTGKFGLMANTIKTKKQNRQNSNTYTALIKHMLFTENVPDSTYTLKQMNTNANHNLGMVFAQTPVSLKILAHPL